LTRISARASHDGPAEERTIASDRRAIIIERKRNGHFSFFGLGDRLGRIFREVVRPDQAAAASDFS
jgi:hypothetical protein